MPCKTSKSRTSHNGRGSQNISPKVGRGFPPTHSQFKKGVSGNVRGRPKGSKNLSTLIMEAARAPVTLTIDGKPRTLSKAQATAIQLATKAASGDQSATTRFLDWIDEIERRAAATRPATFAFTAVDVEILRDVHRRMIACLSPKGVD